MKRLVIALSCAFAFVTLSIVPAFAAPPDIAGHWVVQQSGANGMTTAHLTLTQSGNSIVGRNPTTGTGYTGEFVTDTQINGKWNGPAGAGWLTVFVSPNGHSFNGTWGYNGRAANGSFVGNEVLPPSPITAKGTWKVVGAGGPSAFAGTMLCTQSGAAVLCKVGPITINGKVPAGDKTKVRATWSGPDGSGWFSFWFNSDNNSFNGVYGKGTDTSTVAGRVVGQRSL